VRRYGSVKRFFFVNFVYLSMIRPSIVASGVWLSGAWLLTRHAMHLHSSPQWLGLVLGVGIWCYGLGCLVFVAYFSRSRFLLLLNSMVLGIGSSSWILVGQGFYSHQMLWS
jgi:hypothetical protein